MTVAIEPMGERELAACAAGDEAAADHGFGALATARGNLPLHALSVRATLTGTLARTEITQRFQNPYDEPLEATYIFPLPDRAAVTAMTLRTRDRTITGVLAERGQARADYQAALAEGRQAALAEEDRPGVFTLGVGNLMPGERASVTLALDGPLPYTDGALTYRFPLVVAPRYIPGRPLDDGARAGDGYADDTDAVPDASRITPPVLLPGLPNPVALSIEVDVDPAGLPLGKVRSSLHAVRTSEGDGPLRIAVEPGERLNRDFVLRLPVADEGAYASSLVLAPDPPAAAKSAAGDGDAYGEGTFQLTVLPPADERVLRPRDVVLVIDRSGSMGGWKMVATRRAAARIVDTLTDTDRFAVLSFDDRIETPAGLGEALAGGTDRNRFRAIEHLAGLAARGGTEMLTPLRQAADLLTARADRSRDPVLLLVTDGQVGNEDQILAALAGPLAGIRLHTVGVDTAVNVGFLRRLAGLGGGRCELVESEDRLDEAMRAIHRRIATPLVSGLRLETAGFAPLAGTVVPDPLPDVVAGVPLVVSGRYRRTGAATMTATVTGTRAGGAEWRAEVPAAAGAGAPALTPVWARGHLRDLEDQYATSATHADLDERERHIVATSLRFGVLCRFTAFLAEGADVVNPEGTRHRVTQPVELPQGWQMPVAASMAARRPMAAPVRMFARAAERERHPLIDQAESMPPGAPASAPAAAPPPTPAAPVPARYGEPAPADLVTFAQEELKALRQAEHADIGRRIAVLHDLGARLAGVLDRLDAAGAAQVAGALRALATDLVAPIADGVALESLWMRTLDALELLTSAGPTAPPARSRTAFWRR